MMTAVETKTSTSSTSTHLSTAMSADSPVTTFQILLENAMMIMITMMMVTMMMMTTIMTTTMMTMDMMINAQHSLATTSSVL